MMVSSFRPLVGKLWTLLMLTTAFGLARGGVATAWRRNENGDQTDKSLQEVLT